MRSSVLFSFFVGLLVLGLASGTGQAVPKQAQQAAASQEKVQAAAEEKPATEAPAPTEEAPAAAEEDIPASEEELEYAKNSLCGYCEHCKFCPMCDKECPCETSPTKPNCKMCKYCKYCYLCSAVCDTVCQPGGFIDRISSSIVSALPYHDKDEIDKDIGSVQDWINKKKDEL